jgi:endoglucanase
MYQGYITAVLDAHAAAGIKCFIDLHNYCRYTDFVYQPDGSVKGLVRPANPNIYAFTSDPTQVITRIFATAPGATLTPAHFTDFWRRAASLWKDHPGLGGYGLMNEPYNMPDPGTTTESFDDQQDLTIWPTFAKAAVDAIRAIDPNTPIYLDSNYWSAAFTLAQYNAAWPLQGSNLIYDVHMYLDAASNGQRFDYDVEVAKGFSVGFGQVPITLDTGWKRLKLAVDFAAPRGMRLALGETGMPSDDSRWQEMFQRLVDYARSNGVEVYPWNGGSHWPLHNNPMTFVPGWHQNKTLEPAISGVLKKSAGIALATLFDDGPGYALANTPVTITVYARGNLASPVTVNISSNNGGTLSTSSITLPAGANTQATYTFAPASDRITTLTYSVSGGLNAPPPRKVYSLADPVAYAQTNLAEGARAIVAKYAACKWEMADGWTDYEGGAPAQAGQAMRAIADSGYGSSVGNAMEMLNWMNTDSATLANMPPPVTRLVNGKKAADFTGAATSGFWCRKSFALPQVQNPRNLVPYTVGDPHFMLAAVSLNAPQDGVVFQASNAYVATGSQIAIAGGRPQASIVDSGGGTVTITSNAALAAGTPAVLTFASAPGAQRLRVNSNVVASASGQFAASVCDQMLIGQGFQRFYPQPGFGGNVFAAITGKGAPTTAELQVMENYLASLAG